MPKYMTFASWSSASWARMIENPDDHVDVVRKLSDALGATLQSFHWLALAPHHHDILVIVDAPDSVTASAVNIAVGSTGAVHNIETYELFNEEQLGQALTLAADARNVYRPPGRHE
jgi:uncharacterized protein with GYD domain